MQILPVEHWGLYRDYIGSSLYDKEVEVDHRSDYLKCDVLSCDSKT